MADGPDLRAEQDALESIRIQAEVVARIETALAEAKTELWIRCRDAMDDHPHLERTRIANVAGVSRQYLYDRVQEDI